ncbi:MAG: RrF2 family transcriptional regulator [Armatimonadota bacterium]
MSGLLKVSEAASLALHSMVALARSAERPLPTHRIAEAFDVSEAHLSKVLQRLARVGLVKSIRGPKGGFVLAKPATEISLRDVYEAIDGPLTPTHCLFDDPVCDHEQCIFGDQLVQSSRAVTEYLSNTRLAALADRLSV